MVSNSDVDVLVGVGVPDYPRGSKLFGPREWRGQIKYIIHESCESAFTANTYLSPTAPATQTSLPPKILVTRVTYLFNVEYDPYKVPLSGLLNTISKIIARKVDNMVVSDDLLKTLATYYRLDLFEVVSTEEHGSAEDACVPVKSKACAAVKTVISLEHDATLSPELVTFEFLRRKDNLEGNLEESYYFSYIGEQEVETQTEIILEGVPAKEMENNEVAIFESATKRFLNDVINPISEANGDLQILAVRVIQQNLKDSSQEHSSGMDPSGNRSGRELQTPSSSIGIITFVTGQYQPPSEIDFPGLIKDVIERDKENLVKSLVNLTRSGDNGTIPTGAAYFVNLKNVKGVAQPLTPSPTALEISTTSDEFIWSPTRFMAVFVGSSAILVVIKVLFSFILRRRNSKVADTDNESQNEPKYFCIGTKKKKDRRPKKRSRRSMLLMDDSNDVLSDMIHGDRLKVNRQENDDSTVSTSGNTMSTCSGESTGSGRSKSVRNFYSALEVVDEASDEEDSSTQSEVELSPIEASRKNTKPEYKIVVDDQSVAVSDLTCNTGRLSRTSRSSRSHRDLDDDDAVVSVGRSHRGRRGH
mmetsp:Transcript_36640/g.53573  ORF Transcript_36640/g.53573 Transcript_36640/m.53573 type:complete len:587 (+) Transcript_36640:1-1761(+)